MDEIKIFKYICITFMVFFVTVGGCTAHRDVLRYDAIKAGADPMALSCASGIDSNEQHICTLIAQKEKAK